VFWWEEEYLWARINSKLRFCFNFFENWCRWIFKCWKSFSKIPARRFDDPNSQFFGFLMQICSRVDNHLICIRSDSQLFHQFWGRFVQKSFVSHLSDQYFRTTTGNILNRIVKWSVFQKKQGKERETDGEVICCEEEIHSRKKESEVIGFWETVGEEGASISFTECWESMNAELRYNLLRIFEIGNKIDSSRSSKRNFWWE
jgi:hypothetical protein